MASDRPVLSSPASDIEIGSEVRSRPARSKSACCCASASRRRFRLTAKSAGRGNSLETSGFSVCGEMQQQTLLKAKERTDQGRVLPRSVRLGQRCRLYFCLQRLSSSDGLSRHGASTRGQSCG